MDMLRKILYWIRRFCTLNTLNWMTGLCTLFTIVWSILSYFNIMPFYEIRLYPVNTVTPLINLFPGEKIKLDIEFHKQIYKDKIRSVQWLISKNSNNLYKDEGQNPTIGLPAFEGGTYNLSVDVLSFDNSNMHGEKSFYVVQDNPVKIEIKQKTTILLTPMNTGKSEEVLSKGIEIYKGNNQWVSSQKTSQDKARSTVLKPSNQDSLILDLKPGDVVPLYNGRILFRIKGSNEQLSNYGTVSVPQNSIELKER